MRSECIQELIRGNREIEFAYNNKMYSITYYNDNRPNYISFCEFYKTPTDVQNSRELLRLKIGEKTLEDIFSTLPDSAFEIY